MTTSHLNRGMVERSLYFIDTSRALNLMFSMEEPTRRGRKGNLRQNVRLLLLGIALTSRVGMESHVKACHNVLTQQLPVDLQWDLGILRPIAAKDSGHRPAEELDPEAFALNHDTNRKKRWRKLGVEQLGYEELAFASRKIRTLLDYGFGSAPDLDDEERALRYAIVREISDALCAATTLKRDEVGVFAVDATGQWAWQRGKSKDGKRLEKAIKNGAEPDDLGQLEVPHGDDGEEPGAPDQLSNDPVGVDETGATAPPEQQAVPTQVAKRCLDAAWGYRTGKDGQRNVGFGYHVNTIVGVPDPKNPDTDSEPVLIHGLRFTPANADVAEVTLDMIRTIRERTPFKLLLGDALYTNLRASRWAMPLAELGVKQVLQMTKLTQGWSYASGALLHHGWLYCPSTPRDQLPEMPTEAPPSNSLRHQRATSARQGQAEAVWNDYFERSEAFRNQWAFDRRASGLGADPTSKWICPAAAGKVGCSARGTESTDSAAALGLPVITAPRDWESNPCCRQASINITPTPDEPSHQRKLMQKYYYGSRDWVKAMYRRTYVEGVFGILKNPSRHNFRRGHNRLPGLAMATIVASVKAAVYNEEAMRAWHQRTGRGPVDHPLLQPDPPFWGFKELDQDDFSQVARAHLRRRLELAGPDNSDAEFGVAA